MRNEVLMVFASAVETLRAELEGIKPYQIDQVVDKVDFWIMCTPFSMVHDLPLEADDQTGMRLED